MVDTGGVITAHGQGRILKSMANGSKSGKAGKPSKEAKAAAKAARRQASKERRTQLWQAFQMQRKEDKLLLPLMLGTLIGLAVVFFLVGLIWGLQWFLLPIGLLLGVLGAFIIFGRRVQKTVYGKAEGQAGAAAWALDNMQGSWRVTSAVAGTTQLDAVHRVIGRPGVILVAEGSPQRVKSLLAQEKKKTARLVGDTPIYDIVIGNDEGQVPLSQLQKHLNKLPKNIDTKRMDAIESRLAALSSRGGGAALPKGPMPGGAKMRGVQRTIRRR
ncbi:F0F1-type ATP synthase assembly protein I [Rhodococcus opacus]|nr:F0F1-type ATP synthase assembly protein I [Rhodococcus opacus]